MNVTLRPFESTWYAPMCCVIPPASVSTTFDSRIASRSVVLPWSTWPMIVTTGALHEVLGRVLEGLLDLVLVGGVPDVDLSPDLGGDQLDLFVGERLRHRLRRAEAHQDRDQLRHRHAERLAQVLDGDPGLDRDRAGRLDDLARLLLRARRLVPPAALVVARRAAPLSMTTRRLRPCVP